MKLTALEADRWKMDGGVAFGVVPKSLWTRLLQADENNMISLTNRCLLIEHGGKKILIDAGFGDKRNEKYYSVRYREPERSIVIELQKKGHLPSGITDIIFTHLHDDHVGGATQLNTAGESVCVFENARYWVSEAQWQWAINPNKREVAAYFMDSLQPLADSGRLHLLQENEQPFDNIELWMVNGHTRGQLVPIINDNGRNIVYMGDFIPAVYNIPLPYIPSVDIEPLLTLTEKETFLNKALEKGYALFFEHDVKNECCSLMQGAKGVEVEKIFSLEEWVAV